MHGTTLLFSDDVTAGDALAYGTYASTAPLTAPPEPRKLAPGHTSE